jgi:glycerophosphoryl diester phosphodiesterase
MTFDKGGLKVIEMAPEANGAKSPGDKTTSGLKEAIYFGFDYTINVLKKNPQWIKEAKNLCFSTNA